MNKTTALLALILWISSPLYADSMNGGIEEHTSVSGTHWARSTFTNPAALGFQSERDGSALLTSFDYAHHSTVDSSLSVALAYGVFGAGFERLNEGTTRYSRYSLGMGLPFSQSLYFGARTSIMSSEVQQLNGVFSFDLGAQYRPSKYFSFGLLANHLNQPSQNGAPLPIQYIASTTLSPFSEFLLSFDVDTLSSNFANAFGYQTTLRLRPLAGFDFLVSYKKEKQFSFGFEWSFQETSLFTSYSPTSDTQRWSVGFETTPLRKRGFLESREALLITLDSNLTEEGKKGGLFSSHEPSLIETIQSIEKAKNDPVINRLIIKINTFSLGLAAAYDLYSSILSFRDSGKQVSVFIESAGPKEYLIATAGTTLQMESQAELRFLGPKSERLYLKGTLDKIGIEGQLLAKGEYKSAPETFLRKEASKESRESTLHDLDEIEKALEGAMKKARNKVPTWSTLTKKGIFSPKEALEYGLIDSVGSSLLSIDELRIQHHIVKSPDTQSLRLNLPKKISVIVADGDILASKMRLLSLLGEEQVTPKKMEARFDAAVNDPATEAIVFRISSPGGEILASQQIAQMLEKAKKRKPVIVSMGDMAASGGYYIAAPANHIFANPLTMTGSIGVFLGKPSFQSLYKKIELNKEILSRAPFAGVFSESKNWSEPERRLMTERLNDYYDNFTTFVGLKRKLDKQTTEKAAKGRVWMGVDAKKMQLIDTLGTYWQSINYARETANIHEGDFDVEVVRAKPGLLDSLSPENLFGRVHSDLDSITSLIDLKELRSLVVLSSGPYLYYSPQYLIE